MVGLRSTRLAIAIVSLLCLFSYVAAHMKLTAEELAQHHSRMMRDSETLSRCLQSPKMQKHNARMVVHRDETLHRLREARSLAREEGKRRLCSLLSSYLHVADLARRDSESAEKWTAVNHENQPGHSRDPQDLFNFRWNEDPKYNNTGCALAGLSIYGPFWHEGQPERADIRAGQRGIYLHLAMQVIDVTTCKPLHGSQVDIWQANSMGEYSSTMDGYLRGWQPSSKYGTVDFDTNFPGHYLDRASHIHVVVRALGEKRVIHFGQIYFDQHIRDEVEVSTMSVAW
jgi:hypothetical protein